MHAFRDALDAAREEAGTSGDAPDTAPERWVYHPYDQLSLELGPVAAAPRGTVGIVLVESAWKARRRPYHKQKLAFLLASQRHFALEAARDGVPVRFVSGEEDFATQIRPVADELGGLTCMRPAERELRANLAPLLDEGLLSFREHEGWLTTDDDFAAAGDPEGPWRQDAFYRAVRKRTGILMEDGSPAGGKYSHDADNRESWPGEPSAPEAPSFEPDPVTLEVVRLVEERFDRWPGSVRPEEIPASAEQVEAAWRWAKEACMEEFGPYEDAMSRRSRALFHTRISPLLNLHRLLPGRVVEEVAALDIPLNSKEGLIRQVLGWREFVRRVHEATDGFRMLEGVSVAETPGNGGWGRWSGEAWEPSEGPDGGARPSELGASAALPVAWWGEPSGLHCLDTVVGEVMEHAWTHHIPRLMVLSNLATLLDLSPRELTDWFWVAFVDAYDWVVEPNVLAMGTYGAGPVMTTKPYISGANYIDTMSDYCSGCAFEPGKDCPVTPLYWAFLERHRETLSGNRRLNLQLGSLKRRSEARKADDARTFETVRGLLYAGAPITPEALAE